ncbi:MAG: acetolactate decarboxylase [Candidatus Delongbacteria bacterium]|nr:acetolactate decarboxylase [Candidatus Delongbacteria bacterium]
MLWNRNSHNRLCLNVIGWLIIGWLIVPGIKADAITQISTINALLKGSYDGAISLRELKSFGDFGLGTYHRLDGEMVLLDGTFYQIKADGQITLPDLETTTPFAAVTLFNPVIRCDLDTMMTMKRLESLLDSLLVSRNLFHAIRIDADFSHVKARSVPPQSKPYPELTAVTRKQPVFDIDNSPGTLVGYYCPAYCAGINVPGYHLHYLSDDRKKGGHVLDFTARHLIIKLEPIHHFKLELPRDSFFYSIDLSGNQQDAVRQAEQNPTRPH